MLLVGGRCGAFLLLELLLLLLQHLAGHSYKGAAAAAHALARYD